MEFKSQRITDLLDNTGEGFLSFGLNFYIDNEYSKECEKIFKKELIGENILDLLWGDNTAKKDFFESTLTEVAKSEDKIVRKSFLSLLDKEFIINKKTINIEYKLLESNLYKLLEDKRYMLILTDITDKKKLENKIKKEQDILKMVVSIISNTADFYDIQEDFEIFCSKKEKYINSKHTPLNNLNALYRQIHTFKGLFSQLYMINIVDKLHNFETVISDFIKNTSINNDDLIQLLKDSDFNSWLNKDTEVLIKILGKSFLDEKHIIKVNKKSITKLENKIIKYCKLNQEYANHYQDILEEIEKIKTISIKKSLSSYTKLCKQLSIQFGKEIYKFEIIGDDDVLTPKNFQAFIKALIHIFRNSIDHGIESPELREELEKDPIGTISCSFKKEKNKLIILISDDGAGLNPDIIKSSYIKKGLGTKEELDKLHNSEIFNLIFDDQFSTKNKITNISGRGVGMSAVKDELEKISGKVEINSEINKGTTFTFTLPFKRKELRV